MQQVTMKKSGFIRYSTLGIFCVSMSMSSIAFSEECDRDDGETWCDDTLETSNYFPVIYSGAAITMGANSSVYGDIQSVAAVTLGDAAAVDGSVLAGAAVTLEKDGKISFDLIAGEAATLGAFASVGGDLAAGKAVFIGAESLVTGNLTSGGNTQLGASAMVVGNTSARTSVTLGAQAEIGNNVWAVTGPIVLGANTLVHGDAKAGSVISQAASATIYGNESQHDTTNPNEYDNQAESFVASRQDELTAKQQSLAVKRLDTQIELSTTIDVDRGFHPGVYHASALTTTAGITLTFQGTGGYDEWLINTDTYLSFGANLKIVLVDVAPGSTIEFNSGTYTTIGANSNITGTIFAGTYITTGANTTISGVYNDCGGMFTTNGAVTMGAGSRIGSEGCYPVGLTAGMDDGGDGETYFEDGDGETDFEDGDGETDFEDDDGE